MGILQEKIDCAPNPGQVRGYAVAASRPVAPGHDLTPTHQAVDLILGLFAGKVPGYQPLRATYHNRTHTFGEFVRAERLVVLKPGGGVKQAGCVD